jgi:hypothetical protein
MHGLVNRSIQSFLTDTYGYTLWRGLAQDIGIDPQGFEAMMRYDDALTHALIGHAADRLSRPAEALIEDLGAYLASRDMVRRLLRFGGRDYADFIATLDELPDRIGLAVPDLGFPGITLADLGGGRVQVGCADPVFIPLLAGLLRAMADDYGVLALIDLGTDRRLTVELLDARFSAGRRFDLAGSGAGR